MTIPHSLIKLDHGFGRGVNLTEEHAMSIHVEIPEPLAEKVARAAKSQGKSAETVVLEAVASQLDPLGRLNAALAPIRDSVPRVWSHRRRGRRRLRSGKTRHAARTRSGREMRPPERVVFDCNVFFQAFISATGPAGQLLQRRQRKVADSFRLGIRP